MPTAELAALVGVATEIAQEQERARARKFDPLLQAKVRGRFAQRWLMEEGGPFLRAAQVARLLRVTKEEVVRRRKKHQLLAVQFADKSYAYPAWQFVRKGVVQGLPQVLAAFQEPSSWAQLRFFVSVNRRLKSARPIDRLLKGDVKRVVRAAEEFDEHGAA